MASFALADHGEKINDDLFEIGNENLLGDNNNIDDMKEDQKNVEEDTTLVEDYVSEEDLKRIEEKVDYVKEDDSNYVKDGITDWIKTWKLNGWKTANKKPVKN